MLRSSELVPLSSNITNDTDSVSDKVFSSNLLHNENISSSSNNFSQPTSLLFDNQQIFASINKII